MDNQEELKRRIEEIKKRQEELEQRKKTTIEFPKPSTEPFAKNDDERNKISLDPKVEKSQNSEIKIATEEKSNLGIVIIIILVVIIALLFFIYQNSKNKIISENTSTTFSGSVNPNNSNLVEINGYTYKKGDSDVLSFENTTTIWLNKLYVDGLEFYNNSEVNNAYEEYCKLVEEIEKVDRGVMPGTDKNFQEVTDIEVDNADKDHLKEISQIRQIFDYVNGNDDDLEKNAGCNYKGTKWNTNNNKYKAASFKSNQIAERWNSYSRTVNIVSEIDKLDIADVEYLIKEVTENNNETILSNYSKRELRILRNMVMAMNHYRFQDGELKDYFDKKPWYDGYIENQADIQLNDDQRIFVETVKRYEEI